MSFRLVSPDGDQVFELRRGTALTVGRALTSDVPLLDPTVSRRHASLVADESGIELSDLGSSNGTFVNGQRVEHARIAPGDVLTFGKLSFNVSESDGADNGADTHGARHAPTIVRQRAVPDARQAFAEALRASGSQVVVDETAIVLPDEQRVRQKLALLLEVSKALTRAPDVATLLEKISEIVFQILDVDRFSILLLDEAGDLIPSMARDRTGADLGRTVPLSIARKAIEEKVAILSDDAPEDVRFSGQSIVHQHVRSAVCAPLIGSGKPRRRRAVRRQPNERASVHRGRSRLRDRVLRDRRGRHREQPIRRAHPPRNARAEQLRAVLHAAHGSPDRGVARRHPARRRAAHGRGAVQRHPRLHGRLGVDGA